MEIAQKATMYRTTLRIFPWMMAATTSVLLFTAPGYAQTVGGAVEALQTWDGAAADDQFGYSTAAAGDVNADGVQDILVGAWHASPAGLANAGSAFVYSGVDGSLLYQWDGTFAGDTMGKSVSAAGDVNLDGYADVLVGLVGADPNGLDGAGTVLLYSGMDGSILQQWDGPNAGDAYGASLASVGDLNGDGLPDVVIGAPGNDAANVYSGATGTLIYSWSVSSNPTENFGVAVANAGDTNSDGFEDVIIGANWAGGSSAEGAAYLYSGANGNLLFRFAGLNDGDGLGRAVSAAGDLDNDGFADILIGAPWANSNGKIGSGAASVYSGATQQVIYQWGGEGNGDNFGYSVSNAGDFDGDGQLDVIVGAYFARDQYGLSVGKVSVYSGADGNLLFVEEGAADVRSLGNSVDALGDLNQDGRDDVLVGAYRSNRNGKADSGSVFVFRFNPILSTNTTALSASQGGTIHLDLDFPDAAALENYVTLISATGTGPMVRGIAIPLTPDALLQQSAVGQYPVSTYLNLHGTLNPQGEAAASITFPAGMPQGLIGRTFWLATIAHQLGRLPNYSSVAIPIQVGP